MRDLCTQSALPLLPPPLRLLLAPWGYPPARARLTDLRRAAHQGDVSAQFTLGWMYEHGDDVPQDHREAATWYTRAADQDNAPALNVVGVLYATGQGVPKDPREAVIWYHRAADRGYAPAQYNLGRATYNGDGTPLDRELAATWCRRAADQGDANAQFTLGWMYDDGDGVPQDYRDAATWYTRAAGQGHANAQFSLALLLDAGRGAARDRGAADHWYRLAAAHGHQQAQRMIDALTVRPLPGPFDPYEPSTDDAVLIQRASERAVAAANVLDRHEQNRSAAYSRLYQTITNLDRTAERTNHRLQAIIKALKHRDKETIAIEARLRQTMIDRIGDPQGVPADDEPATGTLTLTNDQESRPDAE